jgi:hypothetical protein
MTESASLTAEIVTFCAAPGISDAIVAGHATALNPFLNRQPGFVPRTLSRTEDGIWTDDVIWRDMAAAQSAAEAIMQDRAVKPFMAAIDLDRVAMTHAPIHARQDRA